MTNGDAVWKVTSLLSHKTSCAPQLFLVEAIFLIAITCYLSSNSLFLWASLSLQGKDFLDSAIESEYLSRTPSPIAICMKAATRGS